MNKIKKILKVGQKAHFWVKNHQNLHVFTGFDTTPRSREKVENTTKKVKDKKTKNLEINKSNKDEKVFETTFYIHTTLL